MDSTGVFDLAVAAERIPGGPEAVREMAGILLQECSRYMQQIRDGLDRQDAKVVERAAHTVKGNADYFGAAAVVAAALRVETLGRDAKLDEAKEAMGALEHEVARLEAALRDLISGGGAEPAG